MRHIIKAILSDTRDVIALLIVMTWCISVYLPEYFVSDTTQKSFETIMLLVLGFFFGRAGNNGSKPQLPEIPKQSNTCNDTTCTKRKNN